jgi:Ser/Thr protein kinase RdoA (MazF antagonist)
MSFDPVLPVVRAEPASTLPDSTDPDSLPAAHQVSSQSDRNGGLQVLNKSIAVWSTHLSLDALKSRLATTEVIAATTLPPPLVGAYEAGALVPSTAWRRLSEKEFSMLADVSPPEAAAHSSVVLLAPSPSFTAELAAIAADQAVETGIDSLHPASADLRVHLEALIVEDGTFMRLGPPLSTCVSISPGGLNTLTLNQNQGLTGLHVDSWDGLVLTERRQSSNRLVINIGTYPRYLIFSPYEVAAITEAMGWQNEFKLDVAQSFLLQGDRRVYRLEVRPGEAYLAPTENLIHDASSIGAAGPDRALMLRAFLKPASKRVAAGHMTESGPAELYMTEAMRKVALEDAIATLGGPGAARVLEYQRGEINDIYRLQTSEKESLALRIRRRVFIQEADAWQVKSVLCAGLVQRGQDLLTSLTFASAASDALRGPIELPTAPTIHGYRHGCASACRPPWELCAWISGPLAGDCGEPWHFAELGRHLVALHHTRFASFRTGLGPTSREIDGVAWLRARLRALALPALERRVGRQCATALRRGRFDTKSLRWSLLHGDLHAGNVIIGDDGVRIIDWDEAIVGPPEFDFAPLKHATRLQLGRQWVQDAELYAAVLNGYRDAGGEADEMLLALGELFYLLKCFFTSHVQGRYVATEDTVEAIVKLTAEVIK